LQPNNKKAAQAGDEAEELTVEERVEQLERAVRRWRVLTLVACLTAIPSLAGVGYFGWGTPRTLRARQFEVMNDKGIPVVVLASQDSNGLIQTRNSLAKPMIVLTADELGDGIMHTFNAKGAEMVQISTTPTGGTVRLLNNLGHEVVGLQSNKSNAGLIMVKNVDGETRESLSGSRR
jgi:hypothetical protein